MGHMIYEISNTEDHSGIKKNRAKTVLFELHPHVLSVPRTVHNIIDNIP